VKIPIPILPRVGQNPLCACEKPVNRAWRAGRGAETRPIIGSTGNYEVAADRGREDR
jgi:hypothetical protein